MRRRPGAGKRAALDYPSAMDAAFHALARRARSEAEISALLAARGAAATLVRKVLGRLRVLGYVDDAKLAAELADRFKERGFGSLRIEAELRRLELADAIVERMTLDGREERALARRTLEQRFRPADLADRKGMGRAARFLAGRGFPAEVIDSLFDVCD
jgi:regulatory protein